MAVLKEAPDSKFVFVVVVARRARQLQAGAPPLLEIPRARKPTRIAQEELERGLLEFQLPDLADPEEQKEARGRKS